MSDVKPTPSPAKKRGTNFSLREKEALISIVNKYASIVECKQTDATTMKQKDDGWECIAKEFNSKDLSEFRSTSKLKTLWDNLKRSTRKHYADVRGNLIRTGGGQQPKSIKDDPLFSLVKEIISGTVEPLQNEFDADYIAEVDDHQESEIEILDVNEGHLEQSDNLVAHTASPDWCSWNPALLRTPKNSRLKVPETIEAEKPSTSTANEKVLEMETSTAVKRKRLELQQLHTQVAGRQRARNPSRVTKFEDLAEHKTEYVKALAANEKAKIALIMATLQLKKETAELEKAVMAQQLINEKLKTELLKKELEK